MPILENPKHELFAQGVAKGMTEYAAYKAAGMGGKNENSTRANASRLRSNEIISARISEIQAEVAKRVLDQEVMTQIEILRELRNIAMFDLADCYDENGRLKNIHDIPPRARRGISSIKVYEELEREGRHFNHVGDTREVKLWDKIKALELSGKHLKMFTDRLVIDPPANPQTSSDKKTFQEFCIAAGYPAPYPKQLEMRAFGIGDTDPRLLLGARGYGKTDYVVILGLAYELYLDPSSTTLIITKSDERNASMLSEIAKACIASGVQFEKETASSLRVKGLLGKDHSVSAVTVGTCSLRGRHPKRIIMDDPVTEEDVSEATRKKVQRVYDEVLKLTDNVLVIGQPAHKFDLFETLRPLVKKMEVPFGSIPELDHDLEAQRLAGVSEESIQASYYLKVISQAGFPFEKIQSIDSFLPCDSSVAYIDPSFTGKDWTALSIFKGYFDGIAVQGRCFKQAWNHCLDEMVKELVRCNVKRICFECNALGDQPIIMLREALKDYRIGVVGKVSTTHKHSRIMAAGPYAEKIFLAETSDREYKTQVTKYEYGSEPDDAPDSLATGLEWLGLIRGKQKS